MSQLPSVGHDGQFTPPQVYRELELSLQRESILGSRVDELEALVTEAHEIWMAGEELIEPQHLHDEDYADRWAHKARAALPALHAQPTESDD